MKKIEINTLKFAANNFIQHQLQNISLKTGLNLCKPSEVSITLTMRCNSKCLQCDIWKGDYDKNAELPTEEWKKILHDLKSYLGHFRLIFTGGEPFLRHDLIELLRYCYEIGIAAGVVTNGFLINSKNAKEIIEARPLNINISLDGGTASTHDYLRGVPGAFQKAIDALLYLRDSKKKSNVGTALIVKTTIMGPNLKELIDLVKWVEKENITAVSFEPLAENLGSSQKDLHWFESNPLWPKEPKLVQDVLDELVMMKKKGSPILNPFSHFQLMKEYFMNPLLPPKRICPTGVRNIGITYNGNVEQCYLITKTPIGNALKEPFKKIWQSKYARKHRSAIRSCKLPCLATCHVNRSLSEKIKLFFSITH